MVKVSYPKTDREKAKLYLHCMLEINLRFEAITSVLASPIIPLFKHETAFLHLRHICELIAIACLAAQGDYETHRAFTKEYSPPKIFIALRKIYPHCFPQPCTVTSANGRHRLDANGVPGAYNENDVTKLWHSAGSYLHRASVAKYLSTTFRPPPDLTPIRRHLLGLTTLLKRHVVPIEIRKPRVVMLQVDLNNGNGGPTARFLTIDEEAETISIEEYHSSFAK